MNLYGSYIRNIENSSFITPFNLGWRYTWCSKLGDSYTKGDDYFSTPDMSFYLSQAMNMAGSNHHSFLISVCASL